MDKLKVIAHIHTDFPEKFGIPRQSGIIPELKGYIVFEPEYRNPDAIKGILEFTHLWLLWEFEGVEKETFTATVRPPKLGGNETRGVFATRSPFRPNPLGLSSVKLENVEITDKGPVLIVSGIDLRDNTPIFDIKPYLAYADSHPEASNGFAEEHIKEKLIVTFGENITEKISSEDRNTIMSILGEDPRPHYQNDPDRTYGLSYKNYNIHFKVLGNEVTVFDIDEK